jgi:peptide/nickel transport system permease protein
VSGLGHVLRQLVRYPTAVLGLLIILGLTVVSIYALTTTSSAEVISLWRGEGDVWVNNPRNALPTWVNYFRKNDLPETIVLDSHEQSKEVSALSADMTEINYTLSFAYRSGDFPQDVVLNFDAEFAEKAPFLTINWLTPDGRDIELYNAAVRSDDSYHLTQDERLQRKLGGLPVQKALFLPADSDTGLPLKGVYTLQLSGLVFEEDSDINTELVLYGQVYGLAGTDANRRDLTVALLWGTPIALAFGLIAAVVTSVIGMILAAIGAWYGGWVDKLVQFFTEVNLVLPFFPISLMIYILYSKSIWSKILR